MPTLSPVRVLLLAMAVALAGLSVPSSVTAQVKDAKPAPDPLVTLNKLFRTEYAAARKATLAAAGPVIVVQFDQLVLFHKGTKTIENFTPAIYHEVKSVAHVPLTLYVTLARHAGKQLAPETLAVLGDLRGRIVAAEKSLAGRAGWTAPILANNEKIVAASLALIDATVKARTIGAAALQRYTRRMRPLVLINADVAARAQLDGLNSLVEKWRQRLGDAAWRKTYVVVLAPRQARPGSLQYAYFRRLMGWRAEGVRLFYAENIFSAGGGANLLGTILLDRGASVDFFANPRRLERDLLADAAIRNLRQMKLDIPKSARGATPAPKK